MKVYLAGMESILNSYKDVKIKTTDNVFGTFFYQKNTTSLLNELAERKHEGLITIDSGAHSFFGYAGISSATHQQNADKSKMPDPDEYVERYFKWLKEHWEKFSYFVELDIQAIVGLDKVKQWRKRMKKEGLYEKCITVYHRCDEWKDYLDMLKDSQSKYVGLEGLRHGKMCVPYMKCLKTAYEKQVKVHGFALTNPSVANEYPFYSIDSTTWTSPVRYGTFFALNRFGSIVQKGPSKENYLDNDIPVDIFSIQKGPEASTAKLSHSAEKFREFERILTSMWEARGVKWQD